MRLLPADPILIYISQNEMGAATLEEITALRQEFGLDKPLVLQYADWISGVVRGDLGRSIFKDEPVVGSIARRLPITIHLGSLAFLMSFIFGITAGVLSAIRRGRPQDTTVTVFANLGITAPIFWVGILMLGSLTPLICFGFSHPIAIGIGAILVIAVGVLMRNMVVYSGADRTWLPGEEKYRARLPKGDEPFMKAW